MARKVLVQKEDFQKETENLEYLKRSLLKHDRIATFLAIISIETGSYTEFNILSELAAMNLQEFLDGRHVEFKVSPHGLMTESAHLADALRFLHKGIEIPAGGESTSDPGSQEGSMTCHHMDLKPENILVYKHRDYHVGIWKISDFGISRIKASVSRQREGKERNGKDLLEVPRMLGELKRSMNSHTGQTSRTNAKRNSGTWQAPEVHKSPEKVVGIESDVWSFGCILVSIIALALGPDVLESVEGKRGKTKDGIHSDFINDDRFYRTTGGVTELNPHIKSWVELLPHRHFQSTDFLLNSQDIIFATLEIDPAARISSGNLHLALKRIFHAHLKERSHPFNDAASAKHNTVQVPQPSPSSPLATLEAPSPSPKINIELIHGENDSHVETQSQQHWPITAESSSSHLSLGLGPELEDDASSHYQTPTPLSKGKGRDISQTLVVEGEAPKLYLHIDTPMAREQELAPLVVPARLSSENQSHGTSVSGPPKSRDHSNFPFPKRTVERIGSLPIEGNRIDDVDDKQSLAKRPTFPSGKVPRSGASKKDFTPGHVLPEDAVMTNGYHPALSNGSALKSPPGGLALGSQSASDTPRNRPIPLPNSKSTPSATKSPPPWPDSERNRYRPQYSHSRVNSLRSEAHPSIRTSSSSGFSNLTGQLEPTTFQLHPPNKRNVTRAIISSDCTLAAFLSPTNIYVYPIRGEEHPWRELSRPPGWKWVSVSISGCFIMAVGQVANGTNGSTVVSH